MSAREYTPIFQGTQAALKIRDPPWLLAKQWQRSGKLQLDLVNITSVECQIGAGGGKFPRKSLPIVHLSNHPNETLSQGWILLS